MNVKKASKYFLKSFQVPLFTPSRATKTPLDFMFALPVDSPPAGSTTRSTFYLSRRWFIINMINYLYILYTFCYHSLVFCCTIEMFVKLYPSSSVTSSASHVTFGAAFMTVLQSKWISDKLSVHCTIDHHSLTLTI